MLIKTYKNVTSLCVKNNWLRAYIFNNGYSRMMCAVYKYIQATIFHLTKDFNNSKTNIKLVDRKEKHVIYMNLLSNIAYSFPFRLKWKRHFFGLFQWKSAELKRLLNVIFLDSLNFSQSQFLQLKLETRENWGIILIDQCPFISRFFCKL